MFTCDKKYAILIGNHMKDCYSDICYLEKALSRYNFDKIISYNDTSPIIAISNFLNQQIRAKDKGIIMIYIHYSGHGVKRGIKINDKVEILSCWLDDKYKIFSSYDFFLLIDKFITLTDQKIKLVITSDSCHSGEFDRYLYEKYKVLKDVDNYKFSYTFISTCSLSLITLPKKDKEGTIKGIIVTLFEELIKEDRDISVENLLSLSRDLSSRKIIKNNIIVRTT